MLQCGESLGVEEEAAPPDRDHPRGLKAPYPCSYSDHTHDVTAVVGARYLKDTHKSKVVYSAASGASLLAKISHFGFTYS